MQVKRLVAALFVSSPLLASAQSNVSIYGIMDAALAREDNGVSNDTKINSGNQSSSRIGFRGTEDLGGGLKALFNIEAGVSLDTGNADSAMWGRRSVVGLQGAFGTVTVGREYTPIAGVAGASDIFGQGYYGTNLSAFNAGRLTRRLSNSINWKSKSFDGFSVAANFGAGEKSSGPSHNLMGVAAEYKMGGFYAGAGYHTFKRVDAGDDKEYALGLGYKFGDVEVKGNYLAADPQGASNKFEQLNLGAAYALNKADKVFVNLQQNKIETGARGNAIAIAFSHSLSKRTNLYATFATMRNNDKATFGLNASSTSITPPATALGVDPKVYNVGIRHTF